MAENVQSRITERETTLKKAGEIVAENAQLHSEVELAIQAQLQEVSGVTDAKNRSYSARGHVAIIHTYVAVTRRGGTETEC